MKCKASYSLVPKCHSKLACPIALPEKSPPIPTTPHPDWGPSLNYLLAFPQYTMYIPAPVPLLKLPSLPETSFPTANSWAPADFTKLQKVESWLPGAVTPVGTKDLFGAIEPL